MTLSSILLTLNPGSAFADALEQWTTNQVSTNLFRLEHVVYGNGRFVAAGGRSDGGAILSSEDGLNWTVRADTNMGTPSLVWGLTYGGGRFVTVGHFGGTSSSTNGSDWTYGNANSAGLFGVAFGYGTYVAVGDGTLGSANSIFISSDGVNWNQSVTKIPAENRDVRDVAYGGRPDPGGAGSTPFLAVAAGTYAYVGSHPFTTWVRVTLPAHGIRVDYYPAWPFGRFVVPTGPGTNLESADGVNWTTVSTGLSGTLGKVTFINGIYLARVGSHLAISSDGTNWTERTSSILPGTSRLASDGKRLVTVGSTPVSPPFSFNAFVYSSDPFIALDIASALPARLILSGIAGRSYRIDYVSALQSTGPNIWEPLTNLVLPVSPYAIEDSESHEIPERYYRAVLLP